MILVLTLLSISDQRSPQVKPSQRKEYPVVEFRGEIGNMNAIILCDNHNGHAKKIYDLCDLDEKGRVRAFRTLIFQFS